MFASLWTKSLRIKLLNNIAAHGDITSNEIVLQF